MTQEEAAIDAGFAPKWARSMASRLSTRANIQGRLQWLEEQAANAKIATAIECKQILTEQIRGKVTDFLTCSADGVWFYDIGPETLRTAAIKKIKTSTIPLSEDGDTKIIVTELELHDPKGAIAELNKMQGNYAKEPEQNVNLRITRYEVVRDEGNG